MSDRVKPREIIQDPDSQLISSLGGLSSATYNRTGDIVYQDKLVNAFVDKNGELKKRSGSIVNTTIAFFDGATGNGVQRFTFDDTKYMVAKVGRTLILLATKDNLNYISYRTYSNVINAVATNDKPSFAVRIEGNYCHVLMSTANQQMLCITIVKSILTTSNITGGNTLTTTMRVPVNGSVFTTANTIIRQDNQIVQPTTVTHSGGNITLVSSNLSLLSSQKPIRTHSFFLLRFVDAQYMPGLYLVNSALRRNVVPLDVNVQVPQELQANPIINEPSQDVTQETLWVYSGNTKVNKVTNRQPANGSEWDFSDGSYFTGAGLLTNPSPSFVSFGGFSPLSVSGSSTTVTMARLRNLVIDGLTGNLFAYVDKAPRTAVYHNSNTSVIGVNGVKPKYFSFASTSVNLNLSAVVEIIHTGATTANINSNEIVNLDPNDGSISIDDGYCIPLYGYGFATTDGVYPDTVAFVGNRLVLTGRVSRIVFSNADWNYRGISFNNCQISSINFSETSAFSVSIGQGSSIVRGFASVNGVTIVSTDTGVYRVSASSSANRPANAVDAIVTRVSNELVSNGDCFAIFGNRVYYVSTNGLYALEYSEQTQELVNQSMSTNVSDQFTNVESLSYVEELRSFLITFGNSTEVLAMNIDSESYYTLKFATNLKPFIDDEGFYFNVPGDSVTYMLIASFRTSSTTDLSNFSYGFTLPGRFVNVSHLPTDVSALVTPAELVPLLSSNTIIAPGNNHVRSIAPSGSVLVQEYASTLGIMPIDSYAVTKAFFSDRLDRSNRIRGVSLMLAGVGSVATIVVQPSNDYADRANSVELWSITNANYQGEPLLNAAFPSYSVRASVGDTNVIKLRQLGITEGWQLALKLNGVRLLGIQFDTSTKSRKRLR